jgi:HK97 family phage major capsid protein
MPAWEIAARRWPDSPELEGMLKAAVVPGSTYDATFAEPLIQVQNATQEFIDLLTEKQIIGRLPGLDMVDFNIDVPRGTGDPTGYWVGEGDNIPLSRSAFDTVSLRFAKVAAIVPMTKELLRFSTPKAETKVRDGLIRALAYRADRDFLDPSKAITTGISPASLTNGVTATEATGTTSDHFVADFGAMMEDMLEANEDPDGVVIVMTPQQALRLSLMRNALGGKEFPDITKAGGNIEGFPVITSTNIAATGDSPTDGTPIIAVNAPNIMVAQDGVEVDMSDQASLQMTDTPDSPETASTVSVSLFQREMVALKAVQRLNWTKKHSTSVQFISHAKYR